MTTHLTVGEYDFSANDKLMTRRVHYISVPTSTAPALVFCAAYALVYIATLTLHHVSIVCPSRRV